MFEWLLGGSKSADKIVDAVVNTGDALFYTDEEKAEGRLKAQELYFKALEIQAKESSASSISRRMICIPIVYTWLLTLLCFIIQSAWRVDTAGTLQALTLTTPLVFAVVGFYIGRHIVQTHSEGKGK